MAGRLETGFGWMAAGILVFFGSHLFSAFRVRGDGAIDRRMGRGPYMGLYSLVAIAGLVLLIWGYGQARNTIGVWDPPVWTRHLNLALMLPAMIILLAAYTPTGHIKKTLKHPMLVATKIWAFGHLLANGDLASILLFGAFLAFAVIDRIAVNRRGDRGAADAAPQLLGDAIAIAGGLGAYAGILFWAHPVLFGVPVLPQ